MTALVYEASLSKDSYGFESRHGHMNIICKWSYNLNEQNNPPLKDKYEFDSHQDYKMGMQLKMDKVVANEGAIVGMESEIWSCIFVEKLKHG